MWLERRAAAAGHADRPGRMLGFASMVSRLRAGTGILMLTLFLVECTPDPRKIARRALEGTVSIEARDQQGDTIATGSGFVVAPGIVITNLHVLEGAWSASVRRVPSDESAEAGRRLREAAYPADGLAGMDRSHDLALIAIGAMQHGVLPLGEASHLAIGDTVFAVGNPLGLEGTFSQGIVSAVRGDSGFLQVTAPVSRGSSGGPVLDTRGRVVGVATAMLRSGQNLNFAVPVESVKALLAARGVVQPLAHAALGSARDRDRMRLKGLVRTMTSHTPGWSTETHTFDLLGNLVEERTIYDSQLDADLGESVTRYAQRDRRVTEDTRGCRRQFSESERTETQDCCHRTLAGATSCSKRTFVFDTEGRLLEERFASPQLKSVRRYDARGCSTSEGSSEDEARYEIKEECDTSGHALVVRRVGSRTNWVRRCTSTVDSVGNWTSRQCRKDGTQEDSTTTRSVTYFQ